LGISSFALELPSELTIGLCYVANHGRILLPSWGSLKKSAMKRFMDADAD
jgi:hypothetical protein